MFSISLGTKRNALENLETLVMQNSEGKNKVREVAVPPATPAYVSLYLVSVLQASSSPAPVQNAFYSIRWAHDFAGFDSPTNHTLPQKVVESAKRRLLYLTSKKLPITPEILQTFFQSRWIFGGH